MFTSLNSITLAFAIMSLLFTSAHADEHKNSKDHSSTNLKLHVFDCGRVLARDTSLFNPLIAKGTEMEMVSPCYLIQHKQGMMLWETGLSDDLISEKNGIEVLNGAFNMSVKKTLLSQLEELNIKPSSINYLSFSHLHNDHTGNAKLFKHATWLMQKAEHNVAYSPDAANYGYHPDDYATLQNIKVKKINGEYDVFGDGRVKIIPTPGHSAGHQSLLVNLKDTGPVLLVGDLYHFQLNRDHYGIPAWNDKKMTVNSFAKIDELLDETNAQLWIYHDKPQFDKLKKSPGFYQ